MSFLFDSIGPFDVRTYSLLAGSSRTLSTSFLSVAIARDVGAWPFSGGSRVWTSYRNPSASGGRGFDGAVYGVDVPHAVETASWIDSWCGVRFPRGSSMPLGCSHHDGFPLGPVDDAALEPHPWGARSGALHLLPHERPVGGTRQSRHSLPHERHVGGS